MCLMPKGIKECSFIPSKTAKAAGCWWELQTLWSWSCQIALGCEYQKNPWTLGTRQKSGDKQPAQSTGLQERKTHAGF